MTTPIRIEELARYFHFHVPPGLPKSQPACFAFCVPTEKTVARWPGFPRAALPDTGRAASGKGLTLEACRMSALGEAIELASACAWGDEALERATAAELGSDALLPSDVLGYSATQLEERDAWNSGIWGSLDWRPAPLQPDTPLDWVAAVDALDGELRWTPADLVFIGRRYAGEEAAVAVATTAGCAAGVTRDAAQLSAVCELIERDAAGRWWYGQVPGTAAPANALAGAPELSHYLHARKRQTRLVDLGAEFGPSVVAAVSFEPDGTRLSLGFACHHDFATAALSATLELLQTEIGIGQREALGDPVTRDWLATAKREFLPAEKSTEKALPYEAKVQRENRLSATLEALSAARHPVIFVDLTRVAFGVPVFRAQAPGLCSDRPRFGSLRMPSTQGGPAHTYPIGV
ncbi:MAG: YcaO-like family protein [Pseudomonadota bacterium]